MTILVLANLSKLPVLLIEVLDFGWAIKDFLDIFGNFLICILSQVNDLRVRTERTELRGLKDFVINAKKKFDRIKLSLGDSSLFQMAVLYLIETDYSVVEDFSVMSFTLSLVIETLDQFIDLDVSEISTHVGKEVFHKLLVS